MSNGETPEAAPSAPARDLSSRRRPVLLLRGAAGALRLAGYTVAGAIGAFLALLPPAMAGGPRGRAAGRAPLPDPSRGSRRAPLPG